MGTSNRENLSKLKKEVLDTAISLLNERLKELDKQNTDLKSALKDNTKSTVGDKHETARAMAHIEQEKLSEQIHQNSKMLSIFNQIDPNNKTDSVQLGSIVKTSKGYFFLSTRLGKIQLGDIHVFCISMVSPLGQQLNGKKTGDVIFLNGKVVIERFS